MTRAGRVPAVHKPSAADVMVKKGRFGIRPSPSFAVCLALRLVLGASADCLCCDRLIDVLVDFLM